MKCMRCGKETNTTTMSWFNTDIICMDCRRKELQHPAIKAAKDAELHAVQQGDYNYPGIGKPADL